MFMHMYMPVVHINRDQHELFFLMNTHPSFCFWGWVVMSSFTSISDAWKITNRFLETLGGKLEPLTRKISLNPLRTSRTTFLIWGTSLKILSGRRQRSIISSWAPDSGGTSGGSQHRKIRLTYERQRWTVSGGESRAFTTMSTTLYSKSLLPFTTNPTRTYSTATLKTKPAFCIIYMQMRCT